FSDLDRFADRCVEKPDSWAFHGVQAEISSFAWKRVSQNDQAGPSIREYDIIRVAWDGALSCGQGPRNRVNRATLRCSGAGQAIEILQRCNSAALRIIDANEHTFREVASGWSAVFPSNSSKFRREWPENVDTFRCDNGRCGGAECIRHHILG